MSDIIRPKELKSESPQEQIVSYTNRLRQKIEGKHLRIAELQKRSEELEQSLTEIEKRQKELSTIARFPERQEEALAEMLKLFERQQEVSNFLRETLIALGIEAEAIEEAYHAIQELSALYESVDTGQKPS